MSQKRFLIKHVGSMGDMIFIVPPVLATLKKRYPDCHITFVTAWGYKRKGRKLEIIWGKWGLPRVARRAEWGLRNQDGFCIALMLTNPHVDQLVHFHSQELSLDGSLCHEEDRSLPTWSSAYYEQQKNSGNYDGVFELDFGIGFTDNPMKKAYAVCGLPNETYSDYKLYFTDEDIRIAKAVMQNIPRPRIAVLEGIEGTSTRGWDPAKVKQLEKKVVETYGVAPHWFGAKHIPTYNGKLLTLRQNIATLTFCEVAIGVLSGPMHFAAAAGVPTICLYSDHPLHRAAPAYFLNEYIPDPKKYHLTVLGPTNYANICLLKEGTTFINLTPAEQKNQQYIDWMNPGQQATKSSLAVITVDEVMHVLADMVFVQ